MNRHLSVILFLWLFTEAVLAKDNNHPTYTNRWAVNIEGGEEVAKRVARQLGFTYKGQLGEFEDHYELVREEHPALSQQEGYHFTRSLKDLDEVKWAKQQRLSKMVYKDFIPNQDQPFRTELRNEPFLGGFISHLLPFGDEQTTVVPVPETHKTHKIRMYNFHTEPAPHSQLERYKGPTKNIELLSSKKSVYTTFFNDPLWTKQWYEQDYRTTEFPVMDLNIVPVYNLGITGKGVTVAIVDTELDLEHPDLKGNINLKKSHDMCKNHPLKEMTHKTKDTNSHGTQCAGLVGMVADNNLCGVGIAYEAEIAAIRTDCEDFTDGDVAKSLIQNYKLIDISSNSWGSEDDPSTIKTLEEIVKKAYIKGTTEGRKGKGIVYFHSAGDGGQKGDNCATDGAINHPYAIAITSANQYGKRSSYGETCTAIFATTYSGDSEKMEKTVTLMPGGTCTSDFGGTSASCAIASGITALVLQANPTLTYRDVMHIIARSAEVAPLADNDSWQKNGNGFWVSDEFGFGLMNAENMVNLAKTWYTVPPKHTCNYHVKLKVPMLISSSQKISVPFETDGCQSSSKNSVFYMEHLEVASVVTSIPRGKITISITSPSGTKSLLLAPRKQDSYYGGLAGLSIMSVHNWGEDPKGKWIIDVELEDSRSMQGVVRDFKITFHGLGSVPANLDGNRVYSAFRLKNGVTELAGRW